MDKLLHTDDKFWSQVPVIQPDSARGRGGCVLNHKITISVQRRKGKEIFTIYISIPYHICGICGFKRNDFITVQIIDGECRVNRTNESGVYKYKLRGKDKLNTKLSFTFPSTNKQTLSYFFPNDNYSIYSTDKCIASPNTLVFAIGNNAKS